MIGYTNLIDKVNIPKLVEALRHLSTGRCDDLHGCEPCAIYETCLTRCVLDAADAIEALQAEVDKANKSAHAYRAMYFTKRGDITIEKIRELDEIDCHFHSALIRLMYKRIEELEAEEKSRKENCEKCADATRRVIIDLQGIIADLRTQLPKQGEWIRHPEVKNIYGGECIECPFCGEKYVVQYIADEKFCRNCGADLRAKMGVQDGK